MAKMVSFRQYVQEILRSATYKACEDSNCIVAIVNDLPGCVTQGDTFDKTRDLLIEAVETWILFALKYGDPLPAINGCKLAISEDEKEPKAANA